jgi:hypothetical protein
MRGMRKTTNSGRDTVEVSVQKCYRCAGLQLSPYLTAELRFPSGRLSHCAAAYAPALWRCVRVRACTLTVVIIVTTGQLSRYSDTASRPALGPTQPLIQCVLGCETDHSPPCSAEVKSRGAIPPLSHASSWHSVLTE